MTIFKKQNRIELEFYTVFNNHINLTYMSTSTNVANIPVWQNLSLENLPNEIWKPVVGYNGYYDISSLGRVKSLSRKVCNRSGSYKTKTRILKGIINPQGYIRFKLSKNNSSKKIFAHRLVAKSFLNCNDSDLDVNHKDGIKDNNSILNLEWCTRSENVLHAISTGLKKYHSGSKHHKSKIVLNLDTGIFYDSAVEDSSSTGYSYQIFKEMVSNRTVNKTAMVYV